MLETEPSVVPPTDPVRDSPATRTVELRGVAFHYPGADDAVLRDISFRPGPGQMTAIIGSTGVGQDHPARR